jgi:outer membrane protein OmpA-like peptidoglycan-associated protein
MSHGRTRPRAALCALILAAAVAGCAAPRNPALDQAHLGFQQVRDDPLVRAHAPIRLDEAGAAILRAVAAYEAGGSEAEVSHLAYLADQRVQIARARALERQALQRIATLDDERQAIQLDARIRQAELAERRARQAEFAERRARQAEAEALALQQKLAELEAEQTERGLVLTLGDILFDVDGTELNPGGFQQVGRIADFLRAFPERNVLIEGHTDGTGADDYNEQLSLRRAYAVEDFLISEGIDPRRVIARGYGKRYPVATNDTTAGRQQNRRVEIVILKEGESDAPRAEPAASLVGPGLAVIALRQA